MKFKTGFINIAILSLGLSGIVFAADYYPPERITCNLNLLGKLSCEYLDRNYVVETGLNLNLRPGRDEIFHFAAAIAYFNSNMKQSAIYFSYHNGSEGVVNLKTVSDSFHPDWVNKSWRKFQEGVYVCDAGYMQCSVTNAITN